MTTRVLKFGGTSVGSLERIRASAAIAAADIRRGDKVAVVVSAMAGETDRLLRLAGGLGHGLGDEETDVVLSAGEQVSAALMAMALRLEGLEAQSFLGWQAGIRTDGPPGAARISGLDASPIRAAMEKGHVPVMAGYQGASKEDRLRTLGRGGTDLSAVALAAALEAHCDIYTDVDGVFTTDPRIEPDARRIEKISYDEMLELAAQGAKVLQTRSAEFAKARNVPLRVLSSFAEPGQSEGTMIMQAEDIAERRIVSGIAYARDQARIALRGLSGAPQSAASVFAGLADADIGIDMIVQSPASESGRTNLEFTIDYRDLDKALEKIGESDAREVLSETGLAKVSVVGLGLNRRADVARILYNALAEQKIGIRTVSTSEIKISVLIENDAVEQAVRALHAAYGLDDA
ncbi:aspartate kinase [Hyphobacterium sp. HN65]|uniref:Aspartokinase n=1 Tax=Hyphobacterium lacteum TaxID=3116575 RepID=A0ABU7LQ82_9PROT|nr:aspartate kinase [Hyphobacterium sp. HN65]MEE2526076.1 aspartate kinase [Hyphobacterium sp. HN65]